MVTMLSGGAAQAETDAEFALDDAQLDALLTGHTVYVETPDGTAPVHYGADGRAAANLPAGPQLRGEWSIADGQYCVSWENGPQNSCTRVLKVRGAVLLRDGATDEPRGRVERIVPGNPERL